jgi:hypothetical protein
MILLELTEKEAEVIRVAVEEREIQHTISLQIGKQESDRKILGICRSILGKLLQAQEPSSDVLLTSKDLFSLISLAKTEYLRLPGNLHISNNVVSENDFKHISFANAVILWLNGHKLLKRLVKFDYTDNSSEFEETEE